MEMLILRRSSYERSLSSSSSEDEQDELEAYRKSKMGLECISSNVSK